MAKLLLAEDDADLGESIVQWLSRQNYFVDWEVDGELALHRLLGFQYDVVILDWQLPRMEGPEICRSFRSKGGKSPILFLTDKGTLLDKEIGFESGADDYLPKPFALKELSMRIRALLRRPGELLQPILNAGIFELRVDEHKFLRRGQQISLTPIEFALMTFFIKNENTVFSAEALFDRVWPGSSERSPDNLKSCMKRLREKIDEDTKDSNIQSIYGVGYRFRAKEID